MPVMTGQTHRLEILNDKFAFCIFHSAFFKFDQRCCQHNLLAHQKVSQERGVISFAEAWRRRMKSLVRKGLGRECEG
jgi:hypothetical protein